MHFSYLFIICIISIACGVPHGAVRFIPESYANRMRPMVEGRSDWCISRQRSWGVPIPAFYRKDNGEALLNPEVISHVRQIVEEKGSNAWPEPHQAFGKWERMDFMDFMWFSCGFHAINSSMACFRPRFPRFELSIAELLPEDYKAQAEDYERGPLNPFNSL